MDEKRVTLSEKEVKRLYVVQQMDAGQLTGQEAAAVLGLSERQVWRLKKAYREKGAVGLAHGNRGKVSPRRTPEEVKGRIVELARKDYKDYNDQHLTEKLAEKHGIVLSRSAVRRIRRGWVARASGGHPNTGRGVNAGRWRG
jgi:transposase